MVAMVLRDTYLCQLVEVLRIGRLTSIAICLQPLQIVFGEILTFRRFLLILARGTTESNTLLSKEPVTRHRLEIILNARENAVNFYKNSGYEVIRETYILFDKIQHFEMKKVL